MLPFQGNTLIKRCLTAVSFLAVLSSAAFAQQTETTSRPTKRFDEERSQEDAKRSLPHDLNSTGRAKYVAYVRDDGSRHDPASSVKPRELTEVVADPSSISHEPHPTITVSTVALLELQAMRESALNLCMQLPDKYRRRLPECAEIFTHEIRLQAIAQETKKIRELPAH